jgi:S-DNA-T family DNA segregation ATPase FtsK/SpoIIIE
MDTNTMLILGGGGVGLAVVVWVLAKVGKALRAVLDALAFAAIVAVALWLAIKVGVWMVKQTVKHWRTALFLLAVAAWCYWLGWVSLAGTVAVLAVALTIWRIAHAYSFDVFAGRHIQAWRLRWTVYAVKLPNWLHACGLSTTVRTETTERRNPLWRSRTNRKVERDHVSKPRVTGVRSGPSWDEVRVKLLPGQTPEDYDTAARALASSRGVQRCQVRELTPNVVSIDFQRRNLLSAPVSSLDLRDGDMISGKAVDVTKVWSGRTEYGTDWNVSLTGSHTLVAGASGSGKNSVMWCPLVSAAPAIRDGLVRVSGIDPKGMELAYGRGVFSRYAVTGADALEVLKDLVGEMERRKALFAGKVRTVPISTDNPLELLEFDELGALTKYTDRKTREQITELVALLTTQGRALGITVRGYVQEPTKDTVPVRDLFPRRVCLRVATKSHVGMVLGENAYDRGAWANRIGESEAGVGYLFGEGIREPLRVRAGWVSDEQVKQLESFVTGRIDYPRTAPLLQLPTNYESEGGAA